MKRLILGGVLVIGSVVVCVAAAKAAATPAEQAEPAGLASFGFGSTWTDLRQQAIREYGLEKASAHTDSWRQPKAKGKLYFSFEFARYDGTGRVRQFVIDNYPVAQKEYEVHLLFDSRDRFYAYRIVEIPSVDLKDYQETVGPRLRRWQEIFETQFGAPAEIGKLPDPATLQATYTPVTRWKFKTHTASVGVFHRGKSYNAQAFVQDDAMVAEEAKRGGGK